MMTSISWVKFRTLSKLLIQLGSEFAAALTFYTVLPVPLSWASEFGAIARWVPLVGLVIGSLLTGLDALWMLLQMPILVRSALVVVVWVALTGGLHLDGAMDSADGLAVLDPEKRLEVMSDSRSGAFGVMAAIALLLLKTTALGGIESDRFWALVLAAMWGRWSQQVAIARYSYLKPEGKGAFHKAALPNFRSVLPGLLLVLSLCGLVGWFRASSWLVVETVGVGGAIALILPAWFQHKLGGHTGDTYGAVVEWTEALFLVSWTVF